MLLQQLSYSHSINTEGYATLEDQQSNLILPHSLHGREGSSFLECVPLNDIVHSKFVVKHGYASIVTRVSSWWIYSHLVSRAFCFSLTHLPWVHWHGIKLIHFVLDTGHKNTLSWNEQLQTLSMVLTPLSLTPFKQQTLMHALMSLMPFFSSVSLGVPMLGYDHFW